LPPMTKVASIRLNDLLALAWSSLRRNRLRSILTIGAIGIGISVMMYLITLGLGLEKLTLGSIEQSNALLTMTVQAGSQDLRPLVPQSIESLKKVPKVETVLPKLVIKGSADLESTKAPVTVNGVDGEYFSTSADTAITIGRAYASDDTQTMIVTTEFLQLFGLDPSKTPLVEFDIALDPTDYPNAAPLTHVTVSGVIDAQAAEVYVPRLYLEQSVHNNFSSYDSAKVRVANADAIESVSADIISQGYKVEAVIDTVQEIQRVFRWIRIVLGGLGLVAIAVASVGMFNTLTISLLERTKEIGIMKALGVKKSDISRLFMSESILMGLIGGVVGVGLALLGEQLTLFSLSLLASLLQGAVPQLFSNQPYVIASFLALAVAIAVVTGIYPSQRATKINPIDAIRYE